MSLSPTEFDQPPSIEVTVFEDGDVAQTALFETLAEAEVFAERWSERGPGVYCEIEDRSHDHTAWQAVGADTALDEDYPTGGGDDD